MVGLYRFDQVEGWIPIFLFAMLFGLSMDYEVFLVTRMREAWDNGADNATAVAFGLERTGRIITAAAIIMCAAFSGFVAGRIVGLQQFGLGLAVAILVDATIVRSLLVPSMMRLSIAGTGGCPSGPRASCGSSRRRSRSAHGRPALRPRRRRPPPASRPGRPPVAFRLTARGAFGDEAMWAGVIVCLFAALGGARLHAGGVCSPL